MNYFLIFFLLTLIIPSADAFQASDKSYHIIADFHNCNKSKLNDEDYLERLLEISAEEGGFHVLKSIYHKFEPQGVTGILMLSESHFSIHTWPEDGFAAVDLFTCGKNRPEKSIRYMQESLECEDADLTMLERRNNFGSIEIKDY